MTIMKTTDEIAKELMEGLEGVTPGPWIRSGCRSNINENCIMVGPDNFLIYAVLHGSHPKDHAGAFKDAAYIALCSPDNIKALLEEREAMKEEIKRLEHDVNYLECTMSR